MTIRKLELRIFCAFITTISRAQKERKTASAAAGNGFEMNSLARTTFWQRFCMLLAGNQEL
jgi:hypothetical protein